MTAEDGTISDSDEDIAIIPLIRTRRRLSRISEEAVNLEPLSCDGGHGSQTTLQAPIISPVISPVIDAEYRQDHIDQVEPPPSALGSVPTSVPASIALQNDQINEGPTPVPPTEIAFKRKFRKRTANQLRPYRYDAFKYGDINYSSDLPSSPIDRPFFQGTSPPMSPEHETSTQDQSSSLLPSSPQAAPVHHHRVIDSSDVESDAETNNFTIKTKKRPISRPMPTRNQATVKNKSTERSRATTITSNPLPSFHNDAQAITALQSFDAEQDSEGSSPESILDSESDSDDSVIEGRIDFDYMTSRRVVDLSKKRTNATDFLRIAARTCRRRASKAPNVVHKPIRKVIRHDKSRQPKLRLIRTNKESMVRKATLNTRRKLSPPNPESSRSTPSRQLLSGENRTKKRESPYAVDQFMTMSASSKRSRFERTNKKLPYPAATPRIWHTPIIQVEDGTYAYPKRPEAREPDWQVETIVRPKVRRDNNHKFWNLYPLPRGSFTKDTFIGSNTLTLLNMPEQWNGEASNQPILTAEMTIEKLSHELDLHESYLINDEIQLETYEHMYSFYFRMAAELLRPDTVIDTELHLFILNRSLSILEKLAEQIDSPEMTTKARLLFTIFCVCAGYSGVQVGYDDKYTKIQEKAFSMVIKHLKALKHTVKIRTLYNRSSVALELVLILYKLDIWTPKLDSFQGNAELHWQLIFIDACVHNFLSTRQQHNWPSVLKLLSPECLDEADCIDYIQRCMALIKSWGWSPSRDVPHKFFDYFARHKKYSDPHLQAVEIPSFVSGNFNGAEHDGDFYAFLELLGMTMLRLRGSSELVALRNRVTPMSVLEAPENGKIDMQLISGAAQRLSIMLVLARTCPQPVRPPIQQVLGIVRLQDSHITIRVKLLSAWNIMARIANTSEETEDCAKWLSRLVQLSVQQYDTLTGTRDREGLANLHRFFTLLYSTLLKLPNAYNFYTGDIVAPLNYDPPETLKALVWRIVQQMPLRALQRAYDQLKQYFERNSEPMNIWTQVLCRLNKPNLKWPHASEPEFLADMLRKITIPFDKIVPKALEFVARPAWNHQEQRFFDTLASVYGHKGGKSRAEIATTLLTSRECALTLLEHLSQNSRSDGLDKYEQLVYANLSDGIRHACFVKFPDLVRDHKFKATAQDQTQSSLRDYIKKGQMLTLEYFLCHKLRAALQAKDTDLFTKEILPCLLSSDFELSDKTAFNIIVNRIFRFYAWLATKKARMHKLLTLFVRITVLSTNFSDCLAYDPKPFIQGMIYYTRYLLNSNMSNDWRPIAHLMMLCSNCVRQLHVKGDYSEWKSLLDELELVANWVKDRLQGKEFKVAQTDIECIGEVEVANDFLQVEYDGSSEDSDIDTLKSADTFLDSLRCLTMKQVIL